VVVGPSVVVVAGVVVGGGGAVVVGGGAVVLVVVAAVVGTTVFSGTGSDVSAGSPDSASPDAVLHPAMRRETKSSL
jgi:hypothetical protein